MTILEDSETHKLSNLLIFQLQEILLCYNFLEETLDALCEGEVSVAAGHSV